MVKRAALLAAMAACFCLARAEAADWKLTYEDSFDRSALGTDWLVLRGDWHINSRHQLQIQRQWSSHSWLMSTVPLRGRNVRVEFDVTIPVDQAGRFGSYVQGGALGWGGGGIDDRVGLEMVGCPADKLEAKSDVPGAVNVLLDKTHHVVILLEDGKYDVRVDGKSVDSGAVAQGRSIINTGLQFFACPGGILDNLQVFTALMAQPLPELNAATPDENRRATVFAARFIDLAKPDCGIQEAIDSLPPGGGAVILPKGTFVLRRYLELRSHTTLMGRGPETVLRAIDATGVNFEKFSVAGGKCVLTVDGPHDFRAGDAFAYGSPLGFRACWGHPGMPHSGTRFRVLAVDGNQLAVSAPPPPEVTRFKKMCLVHFFPPVCSYESEFTEVKDLAILGPMNNPAKAGGGFMVNPVTFGVTSNPRFTRLVIMGFPADGISAQVCDDGRFFDNTVSGVVQGLHPGTTTLRTIVARNYAVDNRATGLFFCWYNSNGAYFRNRFKNLTGYPDSGDVFNTMACNKLSDGMHITVGYNGCLFNNEMPSLTIFGKMRNLRERALTVGPGGRSYDDAPRYFTIGANRLDKLVLYQYIHGNVIAANRSLDGGLPPIEYWADITKPGEDKLSYEPAPNKLPDGNIITDDTQVALPDDLPHAITRTAPVPPPALPEPVLDGRDFYDPNDPTCGFQRALDQLAAKGGTLRLPGGRYVLTRGLDMPSNVTLSGYGTGTILLPGDDLKTMMVVRGRRGVTLRDLAIEGSWGAHEREDAIFINASENVALVALDIRGWEGRGVGCYRSNSIHLADSRVLRVAQEAAHLYRVKDVRLETSSAVRCGAGFVLFRCEEGRLYGNVAALNRANGFSLTGRDLRLIGNNASNNRANGILLFGGRSIGCRDVLVVGNTCAGNNQDGGTFAGIALTGSTTGARVVLNNCGDEQLYATQLVGIREDATAAGNEIRFNSTATFCTRRGHETEPSLVARGKDSVIADNWTETVLPSNDSLESIAWQKAHPPTKP